MEIENKTNNDSESLLVNELAELCIRDQETRKNGYPADSEVDRASTKRMKEIISEIGWPTISKFGETGSYNAWLLVQHADTDVVFQAECLKLMKEAQPEDVDSVLIAYLEDRVLSNQGQPQLYGTQMVPGELGLVPKPIDNINNVNARRAALGLETLEEYQRRLTERLGARTVK